MSNPTYLCPVFCGRLLLDKTGQPIPYGNVWIYYALSTTLANSYIGNTTSSNLNPNPIQLTSASRLPNQIWLPQGQNTRLILMDANNETVWVEDMVLGVSDPSIAQIQALNAYAQANLANNQAAVSNTFATGGLLTAQTAYSTANFAANNTCVYQNGTLVLANANLNFNNTATVSVLAQANTQYKTTNLAFSMSLTSLGVIDLSKAATNGYCNIASNVGMTWNVAYYASNPGTVAITFPQAFLSKCWSVQIMMSSSGYGDYVPRIIAGSLSHTGFSYYFDGLNGSNWIAGSGVYYVAVGDV